MKRKFTNILMVIIVLVTSGMYNNFIVADESTDGKKVVNRRRATTSSRHRKGKEAPIETVQQEKPIENIQAFVSEFDYKAKQKAVDTLLERGIEFCKKNTLQAVCNAFT